MQRRRGVLRYAALRMRSAVEGSARWAAQRGMGNLRTVLKAGCGRTSSLSIRSPALAPGRAALCDLVSAPRVLGALDHHHPQLRAFRGPNCAPPDLARFFPHAQAQPHGFLPQGPGRHIHPEGGLYTLSNRQSPWPQTARCISPPGIKVYKGA